MTKTDSGREERSEMLGKDLQAKPRVLRRGQLRGAEGTMVQGDTRPPNLSH